MPEPESLAADAALVRGRIDALLAAIPPQSVPVEEFWGAQYDAGLAWVHFPEGLGGLGLAPAHQTTIDTALRAAGVPSNALRNLMGVGMAAPTLVEWAERELAEQLLRPLFSCTDIWCQLFSEPGAGSDLAALSTSAVSEGDEWVVNGQKVWTSSAHLARWGLLLARTDPEAPKHAGLTYFVVNMTAAGVNVRPLRQITGDAEFNEVFFTDVRIPDSHRLGPVGVGWRVAVTTLMNERLALSSLTVGERNSGPIRQALRLWRDGGHDDPVLLDELVRLWVDTEVTRLTAQRARENLDRGTPGPESSTTKLAMALNQQRVWELCVRLAGGRGLLIGGYQRSEPTGMAADSAWSGDHDDLDPARCYLEAQGTSIGGGTPDILRTLLGERVLGLPAEPRVDKDIPWRLVPR